MVKYIFQITVPSQLPQLLGCKGGGSGDEQEAHALPSFQQGGEPWSKWHLGYSTAVRIRKMLHFSPFPLQGASVKFTRKKINSLNIGKDRK